MSLLEIFEAKLLLPEQPFLFFGSVKNTFGGFHPHFWGFNKVFDYN